MISRSCVSLCLALALSATTIGVSAHEDHAPKTEAGKLKSDLVWDNSNVEKKLAGLAEATPADKFGWRPAEGVRSVSEVYMHLVQANYGLLRALGVAMPEGAPENFEAITDKAMVVEWLAKSMAHYRSAVEATSDDDLNKMVTLFGNEMSHRKVLLLLENHCHEHLGQAIAYARSIGVTPPWSQPAPKVKESDNGRGN